MEVTSKELEDTKETVALRDAAVEEPRRAVPRRKWTMLDIRTAGGILVWHLLAVFAPFRFSWKAFWFTIIFGNIIGLFGITLSWHRNLAHRSFKLPKWLEYSFAYLGVHAFQGDPIDWVSTHRYHHQFVDTERDPHSPLEGFWFSHIGWMFDSYKATKKVCPKNLENFEERIAKRKVFKNTFVAHVKYGKPNNVEDLQKQAFYRFLRETYLAHHYGLALILYAMGGFPFLVWGMGVRLVLTLHITFLVNSASHIWGYRTWNTKDLSKNNWMVGVMAYGEGWHNNHHAFEYSARQGLQWWEFDMTWCVIRFLEAIGLATDVKLPSQLHMQALALNDQHKVD